MLAPYRVLDLTDWRGEIAGMVLGDLGADVVRVEPPGGSPARQRGPLLSGAPEPEQSLQFYAYNRNKRSVVADLDSEKGRALFERLAAGADFVLESAPPSRLDAAGFDFERLRELNPRIVSVKTTPFGADGPRADQPAADLTLAALGGPLFIQGTPEREPVRVSVPQAWRHAGAESAVAALVAHARMLQTGEAQQVDVSAQCAMTWTMLNAMSAAAIQGHDFRRLGAVLQLGGRETPLVHPCKDGHVVAVTHSPLLNVITPWLVEAGDAPASWLEADWLAWDFTLVTGAASDPPFDDVLAAFRRFTSRHAKQELMQLGLENGLSFAPVNTIPDVLGASQLEARGYFRTCVLPDGSRGRAAGPFVKPSRHELDLRPAPRLDEHGSELRGEPRRTPAAAGHAPSGSADSLPFEGLKVADFSWIGVGPITAKCLADHGATVVRVESLTRPDALRGAGPFKNGEPGIDNTHFFAEFNTSKFGLQLDLKNPAAIEIARRLIAWADVCIESFKPGVMEGLGLGYPAVAEINPSIVMVSTCLMGQSGPASSFAGFGYHAGAVAGFYEVTGWPDLPPDGPWMAYTDTIAPRMLSAALMAALDHRRRTGEGQYLDAAQLEMGLHFLAPEILDYQANGAAATRRGNAEPGAAPHGVYPCAGDDAWCAIAVESDAHWEGLRKALGQPAWASASELDRAAGRVRASAELDRQLADWTRGRSATDVERILREAGVPAGVTQRSSELLRDPQYAHRGFHHHHEHAAMGVVPYTGHQFRIAGYASGPRFAAPTMGQHLHEVLSGLLGLSDDEIGDAIAAGALGV